VKVFRVKSSGESIYPSGKSASENEAILKGKTWGLQTNVYLDVVNTPSPREVDYDMNGTDGLKVGNADDSAEVAAILDAVTDGDAELNIYFVSNFETTENGFEFGVGTKSHIFLKDGIEIDTLAHETGDGLGIRSDKKMG